MGPITETYRKNVNQLREELLKLEKDCLPYIINAYGGTEGLFEFRTGTINFYSIVNNYYTFQRKDIITGDIYNEIKPIRNVKILDFEQYERPHFGDSVEILNYLSLKNIEDLKIINFINEKILENVGVSSVIPSMDINAFYNKRSELRYKIDKTQILYTNLIYDKVIEDIPERTRNYIKEPLDLLLYLDDKPGKFNYL